MKEHEARALVYARAGGRCERCLVRHPTDYSHRVNRSQGGPWSPDNGTHLCHACHMWIHANPNDANTDGWYLRSWQDPLTEPVHMRRGLTWLTEIGTYSSTAPVEVTP